MNVLQVMNGRVASIRLCTIGFAGLFPIIFKIPNQKKTTNNEKREKGIAIFLHRWIIPPSILSKVRFMRIIITKTIAFWGLDVDNMGIICELK